MEKPKSLQSGDRVAIVSLSAGTLGETFCAHNVQIGTQRLREFGLEPVFMPHALKGIDYVKRYPEKRAADLKEVFADPTIKGIICAIGGEDTYRLLPYLLDDPEFLNLVQKHPKIFTGFSDTTHNHLMFYHLGLVTFYGPAFLTDFADIGPMMLPYTKQAFRNFFKGEIMKSITPSPVWYEERTDFSAKAIGTKRIAHKEQQGYIQVQGSSHFSGELLGGCLDSFWEMLTSKRYADQQAICQQYQLFPSISDWKGKLLFLETSERRPTPSLFEQMLLKLKEQGVFSVINGLLFGKPQNEQYAKEYQELLVKVIDNPDLPIVANLNFGHAYPRCALPLGVKATMNVRQQQLTLDEQVFSNQ